MDFDLYADDYETYYSIKDGYTLSGGRMTTEQYVRDSRFKAHMLGVRDPSGQYYVIPHEDIGPYLRWRREDADRRGKRVATCMQHAHFDGLIHSHHYGFYPDMFLDTLAMANLVLQNYAKSLEQMALFFNLSPKNVPYNLFEGIRDLPPHIYNAVAEGCQHDVYLNFEILRLFLKGVPEKRIPPFPRGELEVIDATIKMFTRPTLAIDIDRSFALSQRIMARKDVVLAEVYDFIAEIDIERQAAGEDPLLVTDPRLSKVDQMRKTLRSRDRFADILRELHEEEWIVPTKPKTGKNAQPGETTFAFAKNDPAMQEMLESEDEWLRTICEAKLETASTINETRAARFARTALRGQPVPVYLKYSSTFSLRHSGGDLMNWSNLERLPNFDEKAGHYELDEDGHIKKGEIRLCIVANPPPRSPTGRLPTEPEWQYVPPPAPPGHVKRKKLVIADLSQIECIAHDQLVLTRDRGYVPIQRISLEDYLWDGAEWVRHAGVVMKGWAWTIQYQGLEATAEHIVYPNGESGLEFARARETGCDIRAGGATLSLHEAALRAAKFRRVSPLRRARHQIQFSERGCGSQMDSHQSTPYRLSRYRNRPQRQRRALRTWKLEIVHTSPERQQQKHDVLGANARWTGNGDGGFSTGFPAVSVWARQNQGPSGIRFGGRGNNNPRREGILGTTKKPQKPYRGEHILDSSARRKSDFAGKFFARASRHSFGAHTYAMGQRRYDSGRYSGAVRKPVYDIINAGPRHRFTVNGIVVSNCRMIAWHAGQWDLVKDFADKVDVYSKFIEPYYGYPVSKKTPAERGVGKQLLLSNQYQAGGKTTKRTAALGSYGPPVYLTLEQATSLVKYYRTKNYAIAGRPGFPGHWDKAKACIDFLRLGQDYDWGPVKVHDHRIWLPNGVFLDYSQIDNLGNDEKGYPVWAVRTRRGYTRLYGGKVTAHVNSALARIVMTEALRMIAPRWDVAMTCYDEIVCSVDEDRAEECKAFVEHAMGIEPWWAPGLPVAVEAHISEVYDK